MRTLLSLILFLLTLPTFGQHPRIELSHRIGMIADSQEIAYFRLMPEIDVLDSLLFEETASDSVLLIAHRSLSNRRERREITISRHEFRLLGSYVDCFESITVYPSYSWFDKYEALTSWSAAHTLCQRPKAGRISEIITLSGDTTKGVFLACDTSVIVLAIPSDAVGDSTVQIEMFHYSDIRKAIIASRFGSNATLISMGIGLAIGLAIAQELAYPSSHYPDHFDQGAWWGGLTIGVVVFGGGLWFLSQIFQAISPPIAIFYIDGEANAYQDALDRLTDLAISGNNLPPEVYHKKLENK